MNIDLQLGITVLIVGARRSLKALLGIAVSRRSRLRRLLGGAWWCAPATPPIQFQPRPVDLSPSPIGSGKCTVPATPGSGPRRHCASARSRAMTCTRMSGADAPR